MRAQEGLLGHLFRLRDVVEHAEGHPEDAVLVTGDELLERPDVAGP